MLRFFNKLILQIYRKEPCGLFCQYSDKHLFLSEGFHKFYRRLSNILVRCKCCNIFLIISLVCLLSKQKWFIQREAHWNTSPLLLNTADADPRKKDGLRQWRSYKHISLNELIWYKKKRHKTIFLQIWNMACISYQDCLVGSYVSSNNAPGYDLNTPLGVVT